MIHRSINDELQFFKIERFGQIVVGPEFHRFHRRIDRGIGGHDDDRDSRIAFLDLPQCLYAADIGHPHIHQDQIGRFFPGHPDGVFSVHGGIDRVPETFQDGSKHVQMG